MNKVIVKLTNGTERRGILQVFNVNKATFPIVTENEEGKEETHSIPFDSVKAIYFLREEPSQKNEGPTLHTETVEQTVYAGSISMKLLVEFKDGEILHGSTLRYSPSEKGFFLIPLNPGDMSERIYINTHAVKRVEKTRLLGRILVDQQKITSDQLDKALAYQHENRQKKIGAILVENDLISEKQLHESLDKQKKNNKMLGEILLEAGYITNEQLQIALEIQRNNRKKKLGEILVELHYVTPNDICIALSSQLKFPWMDLSREKITVEVATILSEEVVRRLEILPVGVKFGHRLIVATANPSAVDLAKELGLLTTMAFEFVIVFDGYLSEAIAKFFPPKNQAAAPDSASADTSAPISGPAGEIPSSPSESKK